MDGVPIAVGRESALGLEPHAKSTTKTASRGFPKGYRYLLRSKLKEVQPHPTPVSSKRPMYMALEGGPGVIVGRRFLGVADRDPVDEGVTVQELVTASEQLHVLPMAVRATWVAS